MQIVCTLSTQLWECHTLVRKTAYQRKYQLVSIDLRYINVTALHLPVVVDDVPVEYIQFVVSHSVEDLFQRKNIDKVT